MEIGIIPDAPFDFSLPSESLVRVLVITNCPVSQLSTAVEGNLHLIRREVSTKRTDIHVFNLGMNSL